MIRTKLCACLCGLMALAALPSADEPKAIQPFNGKDLSGWQLKGNAKERSKWRVGKAAVLADDRSKLVFEESGGSELINTASGGVDIYSDFKHGDARIELEVMVPKGSNSGIYVMAEYEVQVFDSFGKTELGQGDMGALYSAAAPRVNASKAPGEWQKFVIDFRAPKFDAAGKKTANAKFVKVTLNDQVIHENVEVKAPTPSCLTGKESATGPLMFQGDHGPIAYRNIKITPVAEK